MRLRPLAVGALLLLLAGCDSNPVPTTPVSPTPVTLQTLTIAGIPAELAVEESVQLSAHAVYSDGRNSNVTSQVRWASLSLACLVDASGMLTALAAELCEVEATLEGRTAAASLRISHANVFTISGTVRERWAPRSPGMQATVTVTSGARAGDRIVTNADGTFVIARVPKETVELTATADGFEDRSVTVTPSRPTAELMMESNTTSREGTFVYIPLHPDFYQEVTFAFRATEYGPVTVQLSSYSGNCEVSHHTAFYAFLTRQDGSVLWSEAMCDGVPVNHTQIVPAGDYRVTVRIVNDMRSDQPPRYFVSYPQ